MDIVTPVIVAALGKLNENIIKDAYEKLKAKLRSKYGAKSSVVVAVERLEEKPHSNGRKEELKEEVAEVKANEDLDIQEIVRQLEKELRKSGVQLINFQQARDYSVLIGGSTNNTTITITDGIDEHKFDQTESRRYNSQGRKKLQEWAEKMASKQEWHWTLLNMAVCDYFDALKCDPQNSGAWINLAYACHLIGQRQKAYGCLEKAESLILTYSNEPSDHYERVKAAIDNNSYLSGGQTSTPPIPNWFSDAHKKLFE